MNRLTRFILAAACVSGYLSGAVRAQPLGTAFTYQGELRNGGTPATGLYDLRFRLYDAPTGGTQVGSTLCADNVNVTDGRFTVSLDFGAQFTGQQRFLEVEVRADTGLGCGDPTGFTTLSPRQALTGTPNALFALNAGQLNGQPASFYQNASNLTSGTLSDARLSGNVARLNTTQTFGAAQTFSAAPSFTAAGAPFSVTSSALVSNLNADLLDGLDSTAFLLSGASAGGDLSGTYPNPTVAGLQGRPVSLVAPFAEQVLAWTGTMWAPGMDSLALPYAKSANLPGGSLFAVTNTANSGASAAARFQSSSTSGMAVLGVAAAGTGQTFGGWFESSSPGGRGVYGYASATTGVTYGVWGQSDSDSGRGVFGLAVSSSGSNFGVVGQSNSSSGTGVLGFVPGNGTNFGVQGQSNSPSGTGVFGLAASLGGATYGVQGHSASESGTGLYGLAFSPNGATYGVHGQSNSFSGTGVYGWAPATFGSTRGVYGKSDSESGTGVFGLASATNGTNYGGYFVSEGSNGFGVRAKALSTTGVTFGGWFESDSTTGRGVLGVAHASSGSTYGGFFQSKSPDGVGLYGWASATTGANIGVYGQSDSTTGNAVYGLASATSGLNFGGYFRSNSTTGAGVAGYATSTSGGCWGVYGSTSSSASNAYGVRGDEPSGSSGHAVYASGTLAASGTKSFQIDHPLNPETHYLNHFCTEAPEPLNAYSGNVVTDELGYAVVQLPDYFESINRDFRYQLTVVDGAGEDFVLARVVRKIQNNQFTIRTSAPNVEVSWEVKAVRNDRYVQQYGFRTVQEKEDQIKGKYVQPELYGKPREQGIHYRPDMERPVPDLERPAPILPERPPLEPLAPARADLAPGPR